MPVHVLASIVLDIVPTWITAVVYGATVIAASFAILFSIIAVAGRMVYPRTIRLRLRAGVFAATLVILLAVLNIYLLIANFYAPR